MWSVAHWKRNYRYEKLSLKTEHVHDGLIFSCLDRDSWIFSSNGNHSIIFQIFLNINVISSFVFSTNEEPRILLKCQEPQYGFLFFFFFLQEDKRDETCFNIVDNEGLMKFSPSRGFRSTTMYLLFISNPLQQKINFYVSITISLHTKSIINNNKKKKKTSTMECKVKQWQYIHLDIMIVLSKKCICVC